MAVHAATAASTARLAIRSSWVLVAGAVAVAALSLLAANAPSYDPWAWLIWGRQIADGGLDTVAGPSWKPLPVLFTTVFALGGEEAAPSLWLVVGRAGWLLAIALAFRLGRRLGGTPGGVIAAAGVVLIARFVTGAAGGESEGLLIAFSLWAIERHLDGHPRQAFAFGVAAALLRPETWPFVGLYGLWLVHRDWSGAARGRALALVGLSGVGVALLWFVPEYAGSGDFFRGASRALEPVPDSPAQEAVPFLAVFDNSSAAVIVPVYAGALLALAFAGRVARVIAAMAAVYMLEVAVLAQIGFTGNLRYVMLPAALVCVVAGAGWPAAIGAAGRRHGRRAAFAAAAVALGVCAPFVLRGVDDVAGDLDRAGDVAAVEDDLDAAIRLAGGAGAVLRCAPVYTGPFQTQVLAWELDVPSRRVGIRPDAPPGTVIAPHDSDARAAPVAADTRFDLVGRTDHWTVRSTCPLGAR